MDRLIYTAMTGAKHLLYRQDALAQNLANANTTGYRADTRRRFARCRRRVRRPARACSRSRPPPAPTSRRARCITTGRALDVAVQGPGWLAVQARDGSEAYTRAGSLQVGADGALQLPNGLLVLGDGGPITVPANAQVSVAADGTISAKTPGAQTSTRSGD